jgi:hypothetical protein
MLIIRHEQMRVLSFALFERWMAPHLHQHFPEECARIGDGLLRDLIARGIAKARVYGFTSEPDICRYIDLMVVLGPDFDADPRFPWAADILNSAAFSNPGLRIEMLHQAALNYLRRIENPADFPPEEEAAEFAPAEEEEEEEAPEEEEEREEEAPAEEQPEEEPEQREPEGEEQQPGEEYELEYPDQKEEPALVPAAGLETVRGG